MSLKDAKAQIAEEAGDTEIKGRGAASRKATDAAQKAKSVGRFRRPDRDYTYKEDTPLDLPQEFMEWLAENQFHYRWIRVIDPENRGEEDYKNIRRKLAQYFTILKLSDLPEDVREIMRLSFDTRKVGQDTGVICVDDVALAIIPIEAVEARRKAMEEKALRFVRANVDLDNFQRRDGNERYVKVDTADVSDKVYGN